MQDQKMQEAVVQKQGRAVSLALVEQAAVGVDCTPRWALGERVLDSLLQAAEQGVSWHQPCFNTMTSDHGGSEVRQGDQV